MEIRHFRYFLAVASHRHFTRAAEQLGIAPSTLTLQIQDLESALGTPLFMREQREVRLTDAGRALQIEAELAVRQFEAGQYNVRRTEQRQTEKIELGYGASAMFSGVLQRQVSQFRQRHAAVDFSMTEHPMPALPRMIEAGRLDVAFIRSPINLPGSLSAVTLLTESFALALPESSWLCELAVIHAADLKNENFILTEQISGALELAAHGGFAPTLGPQPGGLLSVIAQVSLGQGVAVVPESVVDRISLPNVVYRRIEDWRPNSSLSLIHRRNEKTSAVNRFIDQVRQSRES